MATLLINRNYFNNHLLAIAGLYDVWYDAFNEAHPTYTIITTDANELVRPLHYRMQVIRD